jgi:hypothetical protein
MARFENKPLFFKNKSYCSIELEVVLKKDFQYHVAAVDFDEATKDLPQAHFDANTFEASNTRVINFLHRIHYHIESHEYRAARRLLGHIFHTVHDFYAHSNWIEMGNAEINKEIGTPEFVKYHAVANATEDNVTCVSNCKLVKTRCGLFTELMFAFFKLVDFKSPLFSCPIKFYQCETNVILNKLTSGYYVSQRLENGEEVSKPKQGHLCSHGGLFLRNKLIYFYKSQLN